MTLEYVNQLKTAIRVGLDAGETLGNMHGPLDLAFIPVQPGNTEYDAIIAQGLQIKETRDDMLPTLEPAPKGVKL